MASSEQPAKTGTELMICLLTAIFSFVRSVMGSSASTSLSLKELTSQEEVFIELKNLIRELWRHLSVPHECLDLVHLALPLALHKVHVGKQRARTANDDSIHEQTHHDGTCRKVNLQWRLGNDVPSDARRDDTTKEGIGVLYVEVPGNENAAMRCPCVCRQVRRAHCRNHPVAAGEPVPRKERIPTSFARRKMLGSNVSLNSARMRETEDAQQLEDPHHAEQLVDTLTPRRFAQKDDIERHTRKNL